MGDRLDVPRTARLALDDFPFIFLRDAAAGPSGADP